MHGGPATQHFLPGIRRERCLVEVSTLVFLPLLARRERANKLKEQKGGR